VSKQIKRSFALAALVLGFTFVSSAPMIPAAVAAPEPEAVPSRWEFDLEAGKLRVISVNIPNEGQRSFYYWTYKVTNTTGEDLPFNPAFELYTEDGTKSELVRSGRDVPREATETILEKIDNDLLLDEVDIQSGLLLQGRENAREGLVVWPVESYKIDEVVIYAEGFSGESRSVTRPDNGERVVLRKTLMLRHSVEGTLDSTSPRPLRRTVERWILR